MPSCGSLRSGFYARHYEAILGARHSDIEQAARLLQLQWIYNAVTWNWNQLLVFDSNDVYARELESLRGVQREKIDAIPPGLGAVVFREDGTLEEGADLRREIPAGACFDESTQSSHRLGVALVGRFLGAQALHQLMTAEEPDQIVDGR